MSRKLRRGRVPPLYFIPATWYPRPLKNSPNLARLIALNLNSTIFDGSATAAGNPDFFGRLFNHRNGEVCREFINDDHRLATAMARSRRRTTRPRFQRD